MKEKEKLKQAIKEVYDTFPKGMYLNTTELFDIINYEYNFSTGVSKNQISSIISQNTRFERVKRRNEVYYQIKGWLN